MTSSLPPDAKAPDRDDEARSWGAPEPPAHFDYDVLLERDPSQLPGLFQAVFHDDLDWPLPERIFWSFPAHREWYVEQWCRHAEHDPWAWDHARGILNRRVSRGETRSPCLARLAFVPRPRAGRGRKQLTERDLHFLTLVKGLRSEGYSEDEIWEAYREGVPPSSELRDPRNSYRKLLKKKAPRWLFTLGVVEPLRGPRVRVVAPVLPSEEEWSDPEATVRRLLECDFPRKSKSKAKRSRSSRRARSGLSPFLLAWHLWPERSWPFMESCRFLAREPPFVWMHDELRVLLDCLIYWQVDIPPTFATFARQVRPKPPATRLPEDAKRLRAAVVVRKLEELGHDEGQVLEIVRSALAADDTAIDRRVAQSRDLIRYILFCQRGRRLLPWGDSTADLETRMTFRRYDPERYYAPSDPELRLLGTVSTLAHWRHRHVGPPHIRIGNRIWYLGRSLNEFLDEREVGKVPVPVALDAAPEVAANAA